MHKSKRENVIKGTGGMNKAAVVRLLQRHGEKVPFSSYCPSGANVRRSVLFGAIKKFKKFVSEGAEVQTDAWVGYNNLPSEYVHPALK